MVPALQAFRHKPLLLVDGGREPLPDRAFLEGFARRISYPKAYVTLIGADHNCNVQAVGKVIVYDRAIMEQTVSVLDAWYGKTASGRGTVWDYGRNILRWLFYAFPFIGGR